MINAARAAPQVRLCWAQGRPPRGVPARSLVADLKTILCALHQPQSTLNVWIARDADLRTLNLRHRGKDQATDVLAWRYDEGDAQAQEVSRVCAGELLWGELALSLDTARRQARAHAWPLRTEFLRLLAHGCAHLAGWTHETPAEDAAMLQVEQTLLASVGVHGVYEKEPCNGPSSRLLARSLFCKELSKTH